jgi:hypothetical protein
MLLEIFTTGILRPTTVILIIIYLSIIIIRYITTYHSSQSATIVATITTEVHYCILDFVHLNRLN